MPDAAVDAAVARAVVPDEEFRAVLVVARSVVPDEEFRAVLVRGLPVRKQCNVTYSTMVKNK